LPFGALIAQAVVIPMPLHQLWNQYGDLRPGLLRSSSRIQSNIGVITKR
jgi:hypothetical protein